MIDFLYGAVVGVFVATTIGVYRYRQLLKEFEEYADEIENEMSDMYNRLIKAYEEVDNAHRRVAG